MPLQATSGAASYDAFGGGVAAVPTYIEECFSTFLYQGNGSTQTITNGIDLAGKGGLTWIKARDEAGNHCLIDTVRGKDNTLFSNTTDSDDFATNRITAFNANGFSLGTSVRTNKNAINYASWTFREQPKFFDVVTYTGTGIGPRAIPHNLGSVPGCIIVKKTSATQGWPVYHRSVGTSQYLFLNTTSAAISQSVWGDTTPTSTDFYVSDTQNTNGTGETYVAYLFAHNAGGFGLSGTDNVISCGSFTSDGSSFATVNLGYEPQWVLYKSSSNSGRWVLSDNMRGAPASNVASGNSTATGPVLVTELSASEADLGGNPEGHGFIPTATGFRVDPNSYQMTSNQTFIYIAIRRGPMKVPTTGTSVFSPNAQNTGSTPLVTTNFPVDLSIGTDRTGASRYAVDRLRGTTAASSQYLETNSTSAEAASGGGLNFANNIGFTDALLGYSQSIFWNFRRAPGFFDEVCYTGTSVARTVAHNLTVVPELMIVKSRNQINSWAVYLGGPLGGTKTANLDKTFAAYDSSGHWNNTQPTASVFSIGNNGEVNDSGVTYVAYLFASCPGVSKVGSYTGTGTTQTINCGFTGGARFVLIKSTSTTGDWYVWDSARGIVAGNDPYLRLNSTAAEVTTTDWVDTAASGFELSNAGGNLANSNGVSYVFLAVA